MTAAAARLAVFAAGILVAAIGVATGVVVVERQFSNATPLSVEDSPAATNLFLAQVSLQTLLPWLLFAGLAIAVAALALAALQAASAGAATRTRMAPGSVVVENPTTRPNSSPSSSNSSSRSSWTVKRDAVR